jgi:type II secretory pathway component PulF
MAEFQYLAKDDKGLIQKGSIEAESRDIAVQTLIKAWANTTNSTDYQKSKKSYGYKSYLVVTG